MMDNFNFYINVDQCLNMSNFDIFFYKLLKEQRFHLSNVHFYDDKSKNSLQTAMHDIRSYMDKNPFLVGDYRIIFGMRKKRVLHETWTETMLYRLLKIYYSMQDSRIFIRSKEVADKNVSVVMLYDTDFVYDMPELKEYNFLDDMAALMEYLGVFWTKELTNGDIYQKMQEYLKSAEAEKNEDRITRRFLEDFFERYPNITEIKEQKSTESKEMYIHNLINPVVTYMDYCIGHYSVFLKEIDKNSLDQNLLALLTLVDYITTDDKKQQIDKGYYDSKKLKERSRKQWEKSNNDSGIQSRYALMLHNYKLRLEMALKEMRYKIRDLTEGELFPPFKEPAELAGEEGLTSEEEEFYKGDFKEILKEFLKNSRKGDVALKEWELAYTGLKEKLNQMEEELELYGKDLTGKYKEQLEERRREAMKPDKKQDYSQEDMRRQKEAFEKRRQKILDKLKNPKMNPSLKFQDQLNMENALEQCNLEVTFFVKCKDAIKFVNFILLVAFGGGLVALCHLIMQMSSLFSPEKMVYYGIYMVLCFVLYLGTYTAPADYFHQKIKESMRELEKMMEIYIRGYFEKAENFKEYINTINELDAVGCYLARLESNQTKEELSARKYLWHKVQIQEHLRKNSYFEGLMHSLDPSEIEEELHDCKLDADTDVIHNKLYWPQGR